MVQRGINAAINERQSTRKRRPTLVDVACQQIRDTIYSGAHAPGARLPTEVEFGDVLGVSRTVVREAVARLAAEGLVESRHGKGVFVSDTAKYQAFQISRHELDSLADVIQLLELRLSVETEMASLAATRRAEADIMNMRRQLKLLAGAEGEIDESVNADVEFHRAIAKASRNVYYAQFIDFLGVRLVPPRSVYLRRNEARASESYIATISKEHEAIFDAIVCQDAQRARLAARAHMSESLRRHRELESSVSPGASLRSSSGD